MVIQMFAAHNHFAAVGMIPQSPHQIEDGGLARPEEAHQGRQIRPCGIFEVEAVQDCDGFLAAPASRFFTTLRKEMAADMRNSLLLLKRNRMDV